MDDPKVTAGLDSFSLPSVRAHTGGLINYLFLVCHKVTTTNYILLYSPVL